MSLNSHAAPRTERKLRSLGELLDFRNDVVHPKDKPSGMETFVGLEHIERDTGIRLGSAQINLAEMTGRRARFYKGDIVYGYLRPYLNKVWRAEFDGLCSVDQYVLRARPGVDSNYISYFLRSSAFLTTAPVSNTFGQLPRIRSGEIAETPILLPSITEQRRIAAILDQADELRRKRRAVLERLEQLRSSSFTAVIGALESSPHGWTIVTLEDVATQITDGEHLTPRRSDSGIKLLSARNVQMGYLNFDDVDFVDETEFDRIRKRCEPVQGDILISCSGSIGRVARVNGTEPICLVRSVALIKPDHNKVNSLFLEGLLRTPFMQSCIKRATNASGQPNLFQGPLRKLPICNPPLELQEGVAKRFLEIAAIARNAEYHLARLDALFASLQHRAFRGEL